MPVPPRRPSLMWDFEWLSFGALAQSVPHRRRRHCLLAVVLGRRGCHTVGHRPGLHTALATAAFRVGPDTTAAIRGGFDGSVAGVRSLLSVIDRLAPRGVTLGAASLLATPTDRSGCRPPPRHGTVVRARRRRCEAERRAHVAAERIARFEPGVVAVVEDTQVRGLQVAAPSPGVRLPSIGSSTPTGSSRGRLSSVSNAWLSHVSVWRPRWWSGGHPWCVPWGPVSTGLRVSGVARQVPRRGTVRCGRRLRESRPQRQRSIRAFAGQPRAGQRSRSLFSGSLPVLA
jgi:hypothetical protein